MTARRLSQAISEGDGISLIVAVDGAEAARAAEAGGAKAVLAGAAAVAAVQQATALPVLCALRGGDDVAGDADAWVVPPDAELVAWLGEAEIAVRVESEEELADALERLDPEILVLAPGGGADSVLELLADVPAGKLVVAEQGSSSADDLVVLERAGVDAVVVGGR